MLSLVRTSHAVTCPVKAPCAVPFYCQSSSCFHLSCQNSSRCPLLLSELLVVSLVLSELHKLSPLCCQDCIFCLHLSCQNSLRFSLGLSEIFTFFTCPVRTPYVFHLSCQKSLRFSLVLSELLTFFTCPA